MAKYIVYLTSSASTSIEVEAENPEEAGDKAWDAGMPTICAQCSGWGRSGPGLDLSDVWEVSEVEAQKQ
jgi:hypothetical protein